MEYAVETFSLTKIFSDWWGRAKVYAVDELNLQVRYNEVFGLLGPNGSGKTTTLKILLGLLHPTKGRALVLGGQGNDPKINARIGFLPEESYLYRFLNARETLDFYGRLFGLDRQVRKTRIEALLDMVGLKAVASRPVGTYSKGMARRIGLAQALINDPDLLILDEPTTGLDPIGTRQIKDLILQLAARGKTVLLCSHLLADVEDVCDRISILYGGRVQAHGRVKDLLQQTNRRQILTDAISDDAVDEIKRIVADEHAECEVSSPMDRLETFFIRTVTAAQQQEQPTSGAVSTTKIGDFLAAAPTPQSLIDKLVSAPVSRQPEPPTTETEKVPPAETLEAKPDEGLLKQLASSTETVPTQTSAPGPEQPASPVETESPASDRIKTSLLDKLAGRTEDPSADTEQENKPDAGDPENA
ncbi:MAG: ATP-binding cassette domain-containing protein [Phycisphaerales bacterium]|nr:MAG: ATP-binding cassette domain-containing protein [Phycisphaerales bacterium]